ncbi:MAG: hypothetical protein C4584_01355 [Armatimonadetes bacterium]|nr:MAG: hypothetical protein C4584_01355 [Armatimonadota bacterium]
MAKITQLEPQKKNPKRFNIYIDGQFAFGADEDLVVSYRLLVGKILQLQDLEKLLFEAEVGKLMEKMYRWFGIRQRSEKEVCDYFRVKNLESRVKGKEEKSQLVINRAVEVLKQKGLINDLEFAKAWVEARRRSKQKGVRALKVELYQKGIEKEIIEEVLRLTDVRSGQVSEEDLAKLALEKKIKVWKNLPPREFRKKATEFLLRRGFEYEVVKRVVGNLDGEEFFN